MTLHYCRHCGVVVAFDTSDGETEPKYEDCKVCNTASAFLPVTLQIKLID